MVLMMVIVVVWCLIVWVACSDIKDPLIIALSFMPFNIGSIIPFIIIYPLILNIMPEAKARISAVIKGGMLVLTTIGIEFAGYCYQGSFKNIGIIISFYVGIGVVTLFLLIRDREVNKFF
jgi:DHA1 family bicyclomycin/chloramphenicol resistance-like MFS transporter